MITQSVYSMVKKLLDRVQYKDGFEFELLVPSDDECPSIMITMTIPPDEFNGCKLLPGDSARVGKSYMVTNFDLSSEDKFYQKLLEEIILLEGHEAQEQFKVDNKIKFNPHKKNDLIVAIGFQKSEG